MAVNMLACDKKGKIFDVKAQMLGIDTDRKIELLNEMYKNKIVFKKSIHSGLIQIDSIDSTIDILELPEVSDLDYNDLFEYNCFRGNLSVLKFPKCMPVISVRDAYYLKRFERVFAWDNKLVDLDYISYGYGNNLDMLIIQYSDNKKAKICRF